MNTQIGIGDTVSYKREGGYSFENALVLTTDEGSNRALVHWVDMLGQTRQSLVGREFLTVTHRAALTVSEDTISAA